MGLYAVASLDEGFEETLTLHRLGLFGKLGQVFKTTNCIENVNKHIFRHIWNTRLAEAGVTREHRAILAGHSDQRTQDIYTHLAAGGFKGEIISVLDKISRGDT